MRCQSKDDDQQYEKNQKGQVGGRSLGFTQEEIMNYCVESTFIQREAEETGPEVIRYRVGSECSGFSLCLQQLYRQEKGGKELLK